MPKPKSDFTIMDWKEVYTGAACLQIRRDIKEEDQYAAWFNLKKDEFKEEYKKMGEAVADSIHSVCNDMTEALGNVEKAVFDPNIDGLYALTHFSADIYDSDERFNIIVGHRNALMKVAETMATGKALDLSPDEKNYVRETLGARGVDTSLLEGAGIRDAAKGPLTTITFGRALGRESISDWRKADDAALENAFDDMLAPEGTVNDKALYKLGFENSFDTIFINGESINDYYAKNPLKEGESIKADVMRKILNSKANVEIATFDEAYNVNVSTVTAKSGFADKQGFFSRSTNARENRKFKEFSLKDTESRREDIKNKVRGLLTNERMKRALKFEKYDMAIELSSNASERNREFLADFTKISDERRIGTTEIQMYMLSKGMTVEEITSFSDKKEEKLRLAEEYRAMCRNTSPEGKERLREAQEAMKESLAVQLVPDRDLSTSDYILSNAEKLNWLNKAANYSYKNFRGIGRDALNGAIANIFNVTRSQLTYADCFNTDDMVLRSRSADPAAHEALDTAARHKMFLEDYSARMMEIEGPYSAERLNYVNTAEYSALLDRNRMPTDLTSLRTGLDRTKDWILDKGDRRAYIVTGVMNKVCYTGWRDFKFPNHDILGNTYGMNVNMQYKAEQLADRLLEIPIDEFAEHKLSEEIDRNIPGQNPRMKEVIANHIKENTLYAARDKFITDIGYKNDGFHREVDQAIMEASGGLDLKDPYTIRVLSTPDTAQGSLEELKIVEEFKKDNELSDNGINWHAQKASLLTGASAKVGEWTEAKNKQMDSKMDEIVNNTPMGDKRERISDILKWDKQILSNKLEQDRNSYHVVGRPDKLLTCSTFKRIKEFINEKILNRGKEAEAEDEKDRTVRQRPLSSFTGGRRNSGAKPQVRQDPSMTQNNEKKSSSKR